MVLALAVLSSPVALAEEPAAPANAEEAAAAMMADTKLEMSIKVQKAGAKPRRVVKFDPQPGATASYAMVTDQKITMKMDTPQGPMEIPPMGSVMTMPMTTTVGEPTANGLIPLQVTYGTPSVESANPMMQSQMAQSLGVLDGLGFTMLMDDGKVVQTDVSAENQALYEGLQGMVDEFSRNLAAFPEKKIGEGAIYTVDMNMTMGGIQMMATQQVEVLELTDDFIRSKVSYTMDMGDSDFAPPGMPPGASMEITRFEGTGSGEMKTFLKTVSNEGGFDMNMLMDMAFEVPGQGAGGMSMQLDQGMQYKPIE